jgi:GNAT superfamily N-acetyltransferase
VPGLADLANSDDGPSRTAKPEAALLGILFNRHNHRMHLLGSRRQAAGRNRQQVKACPPRRRPWLRALPQWSVPFFVRDATIEDLLVLQAVFRRSSLSNLEDRENLLAHPEALELAPTALADGRVRVATERSGQVVGFATTTVGDRHLELVDLFVDPAWARRGAGSALLADAVEFARTIGLGRIEVTGNPHAYAFYIAVGFVRDDDVATDFGPAARLHLDIET